MFRHPNSHGGYPQNFPPPQHHGGGGGGGGGHGSTYNTFQPGMMMHDDPHGGHESDESGEYDRLGFDTVSNHHHDMQQGMMRPPNPRNLPPHQRLFQNEFCHGPPTGPPHQMAQQGRPNGYQAQSIQGSQHPGQGGHPGHPGHPGGDMSRHSKQSEELHYVEHLRRRLDSLLNAAEKMDFETDQAANAWRSYQDVRSTSMRRSNSMRSLNRSIGGDSARHMDQMSNSFPNNFNPNQMAPNQQFQNGPPMNHHDPRNGPMNPQMNGPPMHQQMNGPRGMDPRGMDTRSLDPRMDPRGMDPRGMDTRSLDPRMDPRGMDPRAMDPRGMDPRGMDPRGMDPRSHMNHPPNARGDRSSNFPQEEIGHTYTNVSYDGRMNLETDPRNPRWEPQKRGNSHRNQKAPPEGMDMGPSKQRGGMITQEELKRRIELQQKENQTQSLEVQQMQFHQQQFNQRQQLHQQQQQQQHQQQQQQYPPAAQRQIATANVVHPMKAESPLQSIGRPADNHQRLQNINQYNAHQLMHLQQQMRMPNMHGINPHLHQHPHHQHPHLHSHQHHHNHHAQQVRGAQFFDDSRLGTLSEPGANFADLSDLRSEAGKPLTRAKAMSLSVPDLTDETNIFRPISPDLIDPTIAARERAEQMMKLQHLVKKENPVTFEKPVTNTNHATHSKPKKFERKQARKISSDSDTSGDMPGTNPPEPKNQSESVFLKSLSALRDNVLTPAADDDAVHQAGRLLGAMGINNDSDSDIDAKSTSSSIRRRKSVRFAIPSAANDQNDSCSSL